jgi:hypothetical protein
MPPVLIISPVLGSLYGLLFFMMVGAKQRRMINFWLVGAAGFLLGQFVAEYVQLSHFTLGDVHVVEGSLLCWAALIVLYLRK